MGEGQHRNGVSVDIATHQWAHRGLAEGKGTTSGGSVCWHSRKLGMLLPHPPRTPLALDAVFQDLQGPGEGWVTAP